MGIVVIGAVFVDIKGYPINQFVPDGRNAGKVIETHGVVSSNVEEDIANAELNKYAGRIDNFFTQNIQPVLAQVSQKAAHEAETKFYEEYPGLAPYKSVVNVMTASIAQQNPKLLQVPEKQFKEILVNEISKVIKQSIPNFDPKVKLDNGGAVANPVQQKATTSVPKATTRTFSSGGLIRKTQNGRKRNTWLPFGGAVSR